MNQFGRGLSQGDFLGNLCNRSIDFLRKSSVNWMKKFKDVYGKVVGRDLFKEQIPSSSAYEEALYHLPKNEKKREMLILFE